MYALESNVESNVSRQPAKLVYYKADKAKSRVLHTNLCNHATANS